MTPTAWNFLLSFRKVEQLGHKQFLCCNAGPINFLSNDTQCKHILDVRTRQLGTKHCILAAIAPLSKDNSLQALLP